MEILKPNIEGQEVAYIVKDHFYVRIKDYGRKSLLRNILVSPGIHSWCWVDIDGNKVIDLYQIGKNLMPFDTIVNRAVNDLYGTVYKFETFDKLVSNWNKIVYIDNIKTIYHSEKEI